MSDILFTDKQKIGMSELEHDVEYRYIPKEDMQDLIDYAWAKGESVSAMIREEHPSYGSAESLAKALGAKIVIREKGPERIFSEYYSRKKEIHLIVQAMEGNYIPKNAECLRRKDFDSVKEIFIMHELYHHLECTDERVGLTFQEKQVTLFSVGPFRIRRGLRSLSEIAAHSFVRSMLRIEHSY